MALNPVGKGLLWTAVGGAVGAAAGTAAIWKRINQIGPYRGMRLMEIRGADTNPLFDAFPGLSERLPWTSLGQYPTPIDTLVHPQMGTPILVKRDDLAALLYGGNKVRKLEFLLADAQMSGADLLITMGGHGSNHALATALHGRRLGMDSELLLYPQPDTPTVRRNYAAMLASGAEILPVSGIPGAFTAAGRRMVQHRMTGRRPYFVMVGGSSRLGCMGHVAAALELATQFRTDGIDPPERIFVPLGTCGTAVGLIVGLKLAGLPCRVTAVRVADPFPANAAVVRTMANDLAGWLARASPQIPRIRVEATDFDVVTDFFGPGYGVPTVEAEEAVKTVEPMLSLETTYTGKTLAACLQWIAYDSGMHAMFWNSYSSSPLELEARGRGPDRLRHLLQTPDFE